MKMTTLLLLLSISSLIVFSSSAASPNITSVLEKSGCDTFATLVQSTGVAKALDKASKKGLTLFAPTNDAFKKPNIPDLDDLTNAELISLLQYHALTSYTTKESLKNMTNDPISTLATNGAGKFELRVKKVGDDVEIIAGVDSARVSSTAVDEAPVCVFTVDELLLPVELYGSSQPPEDSPAADAPAPAPAKNAAREAEGNAKAVLALAVSVFVVVFLMP